MAEFQTTEATLVTLLDELPAAVLVESSGKPAFANQPALTLFGCESRHIIKQLPVSELLSDLPAHVPEGTSFAFTSMAQSLNGERIPVAVRTGRLSLGDGGMNVHIIQRRSASSHCEDSSRSLSEVFKKLRRAAHDLNQPLTIISGKAQLLMLDMDPNDPRYRSIEAINNAVFRLVQMVQEMGAMVRAADSSV